MYTVHFTVCSGSGSGGSDAHYTADIGLGVLPVGRGEDFTPIAARSDSFELPAGVETWHVLLAPPLLQYFRNHLPSRRHPCHLTPILHFTPGYLS